MVKINYSKFMESIQIMVISILEKFKEGLDTKSHSDKTFTAKITETLSNEKYKILYCGNSFTVSSSIPGAIGDTVRVCAPCNNWRDLYVIENKTKGKTLRDVHEKAKELTSTVSEMLISLSETRVNLHQLGEKSFGVTPDTLGFFGMWGHVFSKHGNCYGKKVGDNYYLGVSSEGKIFIGLQLNNATLITWYSLQLVKSN